MYGLNKAEGLDALGRKARPCRKCGDPIALIETPAGKRMPVDVGAPQLRLVVGGAGDVVETVWVYTSHFETCTQWRKSPAKNGREPAEETKPPAPPEASIDAPEVVMPGPDPPGASAPRLKPRNAAPEVDEDADPNAWRESVRAKSSKAIHARLAALAARHDLHRGWLGRPIHDLGYQISGLRRGDAQWSHVSVRALKALHRVIDALSQLPDRAAVEAAMGAHMRDAGLEYVPHKMMGET